MLLYLQQNAFYLYRSDDFMRTVVNNGPTTTLKGFMESRLTENAGNKKKCDQLIFVRFQKVRKRGNGPVYQSPC